MSNTRQFIKECQEAYYAGHPLISNEEYDAIVANYPELEEEIGSKGDIKLVFPVYSLQKFYPCRGDKSPVLKDAVESPKLDGCAVTHVYLQGKYAYSTTRGNGKMGKDCSHTAGKLVMPNLYYAFDGELPEIIQIRGEVVPTKKVENIRNYASGAVNLKSSEEFLERKEEGGLIFVAYGVNCSERPEGLSQDFRSDMFFLERLGFDTVLTAEVQMMACSGEIITDGTVFRENDNTVYWQAGFTNKFPKGAYAEKEDEEGEVTTLLDVKWQTGKSGKVTPVGWFEPVIIDDAKVEKATLNNIEFINALDLEIGCQIRVIRAGGVIPKIVGRVYD